jgi:hypothetical protein
MTRNIMAITDALPRRRGRGRVRRRRAALVHVRVIAELPMRYLAIW